MRAGLAAEVAALLIVGGAVATGLATVGPPDTVPATAPATVFSAERALAPLRTITRAPHPVGSGDHDRVRDFLVEQLDSLGLADVHVQHATGFNTLGNVPRGATVENIVGRRRGTHSSGTVMLVAHYDAVPRSFGAGDDGAGVAAILESLRALQQDIPPANDLIVLFTDAEEEGLLGAEAFVHLHPWGEDARIVLNFEGRGNRGPSFMFQTSDGNGRLIEALAEAVPASQANSMAGDIYRRLPNDTDLSIWLHSNLRMSGLNFSFIGGHPAYHTPLDRYEKLDVRSLQQQGEYALGMARHFGSAPLDSLHADDAIYFTVAVAGLLHYPGAWALPLALLALVACCTICTLSARRGMLTGRGVLQGMGLSFGALAGASLIAWVLWRLISLMHPAYGDLLQGEPYNSKAYLAGFSAMTVTLIIAMQRRSVQRTTMLQLAIAPLCLWSIVNLAAALWLPGSSWLLTWPLLSILAATAWWSGKQPQYGAAIVVMAASTIPAALLWPPLIVALEEAMTVQMIAACMALVALAMTLLVIPILLIGRSWRWALPLCAILAAGGFGMAEATSGFTTERKHPDSLVYLMDADSSHGWWISFDREMDEWTRQFLGDRPQRTSFAKYHLGTSQLFLASEGKTADLGLPRAELAETQTVVDGRRVHLRLGGPGRSAELAFYCEQAGVSISDVVLNGRSLPDGMGDMYSPGFRKSSSGLVLDYFGVPAEGVDLWLTIHSTTPALFSMMTFSDGLPPLGSGPNPVRPAWLMSKPFLHTDVTMVRRTLRL